MLKLANHPHDTLSTQELAIYWHPVSERTIRYWIAKGALRATRVGRRLLVAKVDAIAYGTPIETDTPVLGPIASA